MRDRKARDSCVTITTLFEPCTERSRSSRISPPVESRLPVGSSEDDARPAHERTTDRDALLLLAAELDGQLAFVRELIFDQLASPTPCRASPAMESGKTTFSSAVSIGSRLKN
jgi:hypothetical protein